MTRYSKAATLIVAVLAAVAVPSLNAGWLQQDIPVCTDPGVQQNPLIVSDDAGGAFVAWQDARSYEIYVQKLDSDGNPLWTANGVMASATSGSAILQAVLPDGAGGAFVRCQEEIWAGSFDCPIHYSRIFVGKLDASGNRLWQVGATATTGYGSELNGRMELDGAGGVILVWRSGTLYCEPYACCYWQNYQIYAQRIDASGNRLWGASPVKVTLTTSDQDTPYVIGDGSGNVIVAWPDSRNATVDIYAQKLDVNGNRLWGDTGVPVITYAAGQTNPRLVPDGAGGLIAAWTDGRTATHIYAQRLDASGNPLWAPAGVPVCTVNGTKSAIGIATGPSGSAIVYWVMPAGGVSTLFAQRLDPAGTPLWITNGKQISDARNPCQSAQAIRAGGGETVFSWQQDVPQPPNSAIRGLWGFSSTDIFAVGEGGLILHFDGTSWTMMTSPTTNHLYAVWGTSHDNLYAVGQNCMIIHYDGTSWHKETYVGTSTQLYGVWGSGANDVWVVGMTRQMYHWNGSAWQRSQPAAADFYGVCGTSSSNVYAVGVMAGAYLVLNYNGTSWTNVSPGSSGTLRSVWVSADNHVFAGAEDRFLHNDGSGWKTVMLPYDIGYGFGMWGTHAANVYGIHEGGYLMHWNGSSASVSLVSTNYLYGVWGTFGSDIWVCGKAHTIRHYAGAGWVTQNQLGGDIFVSKVDSLGIALWNDYGAHALVSLDDQATPSLAADESGNAILAWRDGRNANWDIYARKVSISRGPVIATELMSFDAAPLEGGIKVTWALSSFDEGASFVIVRASGEEGVSWETVFPAISRDRLSFSFVDESVSAGSIFRYQVRIRDGEGERALFETNAIEAPAIPLTLYQNFPNPFNPSTTIRYYLPAPCRVNVAIYDVSGRLVASLFDGARPAGHQSIVWTGVDSHGGRAASGVYFCRLRAGKETLTRKMILMR